MPVLSEQAGGRESDVPEVPRQTERTEKGKTEGVGGIKMSMEIIERKPAEQTKTKIKCESHEQVSYSSDGRLAVRILQHDGDVLVVFDRPLSQLLIRFVKDGIMDMEPEYWEQNHA